VKPAWVGRLCLLAGCLSLASTPSRARDAQRVQQVTVGRGLGIAACEGIDARNTNRAASDFPAAPQVTFRTRLAGGIGQAPASTAHGDLIVVHSEPRLSQLDAQGRTLWSERLSSEASSAPVLTSAGAILIVTRDGDVSLYSNSGKLRAKRALPLNDPRRRTLSVPTGNGGALVASGSELLELDERGALVRKLHGSGNLSTVAEADGALIAVTESGQVQVAHATGDLDLVGSFGGGVPEASAIAGGRVFAIVDGHKWSSLDLKTGRVSLLANEQNLPLSGPAALLEAPSVALVAGGGFISMRANDGTETARVALNASPQGIEPALRSSRPALLVSDRNGTIAAVQAGNDALVLRRGGSALRLDETSCLDPFRPTPTKAGIVFACRSGQLFGVSGTAR
jgi:hypothetical protein